LLQAWPDVAVPPIIKEITDEWRSASQFGRCFLGHVARTKSPRPPSLRKAVFDLVAGEEPGSVHALEEAISILLKSPLTPEESAHLSPVALNRLKQDPDDTDKALRYLALALVADPDSGVAAIERWVQAGLWCADERAELLFAHLFDPYRNRIPTSPAKLPMAGLEQLLKLVFRHIRPQDDHVHEGPPLRDRRDDAENARNAILSALMNRTGPDAHGAILRIAEDLAPDRQRRFRELAQGMAERDADPPAWAPIDILRFEQKGLWPARTGDDLMRLILGVLADIGRGLTANDASSRLALLNCPDETAVQGWLAEQLELRSRGRYSRVQEAITNRRDRIDILVRSSAAPVELSIELKRGDNWRAAELRDALLGQLREGYLLPENRRHGILFVTRHEKSSWRPTDHPSRVDFRRLIEWLSTEAAAATAADGNSRVLRVIGLDADPHDPGAASRRR
jgi:hypothetical protein